MKINVRISRNCKKRYFALDSSTQQFVYEIVSVLYESANGLPRPFWERVLSYLGWHVGFDCELTLKRVSESDLAVVFNQYDEWGALCTLAILSAVVDELVRDPYRITSLLEVLSSVSDSNLEGALLGWVHHV